MLILKGLPMILGVALLFVSLVVGVLMIFKPSVIINLNKKPINFLMFRRSMRALDIPRYIDYVFYRHHKLIGTIITFTSIYMLYYFTLIYDADIISGLVHGSKYADIVKMLANTLQLFLLLTGIFTLIIGVIMVVRPSMLKGFEAWSNRWISTYQIPGLLSADRDQVNQLVYKYPRLVGIIIITLGLYAAIGLIMFYI